MADEGELMSGGPGGQWGLLGGPKLGGAGGLRSTISFPEKLSW